MYKIINILFLGLAIFSFAGFTSAEAWFWDKEKKAEKAYQRSNEEAEKGFSELDNESDKLKKEEDAKPAPDSIMEHKNGDLSFAPAVEIHSVKDNESFDKQSPLEDIEKKRPAMCFQDYPLINGLPNWVVSPSEDGYLTAVGLGIYGDGGIEGQKRAAKIQAQGEIAKILNVRIESELKTEKQIIGTGDNASVSSDMTSHSRQRSSAALDYVEELKCWIDPDTKDYYVLMGVPYDKLQNY